MTLSRHSIAAMAAPTDRNRMLQLHAQKHKVQVVPASRTTPPQMRDTAIIPP
jgi:hypothetical protein